MLRQELLLEKAPVQVSCVHPGGVKTNIARAARKGPSDAHRDLGVNFDRFAKTTAAQAASIILQGIMRNKPRIFVGMDSKLLDLMQRIMGSGYQSIVGRGYDKRLNAD